ncbi:MAG TPA: IS630 family transposase [Blastocatellia bacterium]|nr:IS630 family transposase [Blastocatellia bacterium]
MKRPTKFVEPLTKAQRQQLKEVMKSDVPSRRRMRAHAILLSDRRYSVDQIADIYEVDRDRVSAWLDWWADHQFDGLDDDPRSGRPPKLTDKQQQRAITQTLKEPRSLRQGLAWITETFRETVSRDTLKRWLKAGGYTWKRLRRSLRSLRNEADFRAVQQLLAELRADSLRPGSGFDLWYGDEAGFTTTPCTPYAWQQVGERLELACTHGPRQNVLGLLNQRERFHSYAFETTLDSPTIIHCLDLFCGQLERPAFLVIDNAPPHHSDEFEERLAEWADNDLLVMYLPPYCPELNLIEHLWQKIKYRWLPLEASQSFKRMTEALFEILAGIGSKYRITFA